VNIIYALIDPRPERLGEIRYIGKSTNGLRRPSLLHKARCGSWQKHLRSLSTKEEILVLEEFATPEELIEAEIFYIGYFKMIGADLLNMTQGGEGGATRTGMKCSPETIRRMKEAALRRGAHLSPESLSKIYEKTGHTIRCSNGQTFRSINQASIVLGIPRHHISRKMSGGGLTFELIQSSLSLRRIKKTGNLSDPSLVKS
jgi:hypothetical protein